MFFFSANVSQQERIAKKIFMQQLYHISSFLGDGDTQLEGLTAELLTMWDLELKFEVCAIFLGYLKILSNVSFLR